ncbi:MAG: DUF1844 domain-containing protein [Planctomycetota bacterium]|nr:DUF1844 domain-containing protein [Planctomycetota bacterium]
MADAPKIHIDSDWKAQAQAEKQKLSEHAAKAPAKAAAGAPGAGGMPAASFETLINTMATQALFAMGAIPDPRTGQRMQHLDLARHHIDMLTVIEQKTKGNLTEEETTTLSTVIYELRTRYIQMASAARGG